MCQFVAAGTLFLLFCANAGMCDRIARLKEITGDERVKVVWSRSPSNRFGFESDWGVDQVLCGLDTESGIEDTILSTLSNYQRPLITHNGCHVVYSNKTDTGVHIVDWNGTEQPRRVATGVAGCLWLDTASGAEYAFICEQHEGPTLGDVLKVNINDTTDKTVVLGANSSRKVNGQWLCVSSDASRLGGVWGWPACKTYKIGEPGNGIEVESGGCWTSMPYDTSYVLLHMNASHTGMVVAGFNGMYTEKTEIPTMIMNHARLASYKTRHICAATGMSEDGGQCGGMVIIFTLDTGLTVMSDSVWVTERSRAYGDGLPDMWSGLPDTGGSTGVGRIEHMHDQEPASIVSRRAQAFVKAVYGLDGRRVKVQHSRLSRIHADLKAGWYVVDCAGGERTSYVTAER